MPPDGSRFFREKSEGRLRANITPFSERSSVAGNTEELLLKIRELEKEVAHWKSQVKEQRYGLNWIDVPEAFDKESENSIPILEEVPEKAIKNNDGKPTHILIEGDNYHALTCLNYTHKGKIDVIYIDPPYNTGKEFTYKDSRLLDKFPDGSTIDKKHPVRHSAWLSFMNKRLKLAYNLMSEKGLIFLSIDDNEQANLKLLCNQIWGEENFIANLPRITKSSGKTTDDIALNHDYILIYAKNISKAKISPLPHSDDGFKNEDEFVELRGKYKLNQTLDYDSLQYSSSLDYPIEIEGETFYPGSSYDDYIERKNGNHRRADWAWRWSKELFDFGFENGFIVVKKSRNGSRIYTKTYQFASIEDSDDGYHIEYADRKKPIQSIDFIDSIYSNDCAKKELLKLFKTVDFDYPKPTSLMFQFLRALDGYKTVLDFFAGSGTTLHATIRLNNEDNGNRQCILVQEKEGNKNICERITYERNKKIIEGYTSFKRKRPSVHIPGLGNSLKYYRTAFIGKHCSKEALDSDKMELAAKAGCLIALAEQTMETIPVENENQEFFQIFNDNKSHYTAIYFNSDYDKFDKLVEQVESIRKQNRGSKFNVYVFSWDQPDIFENEFHDLRGITIKGIPQPILEIYKTING